MWIYDRLLNPNLFSHHTTNCRQATTAVPGDYCQGNKDFSFKPESLPLSSTAQWETLRGAGATWAPWRSWKGRKVSSLSCRFPSSGLLAPKSAPEQGQVFYRVRTLQGEKWRKEAACITAGDKWTLQGEFNQDWGTVEYPAGSAVGANGGGMEHTTSRTAHPHCPAPMVVLPSIQHQLDTLCLCCSPWFAAPWQGCRLGWPLCFDTGSEIWVWHFPLSAARLGEGNGKQNKAWCVLRL